LDSTTRLRFREFVFDHVRKSHLPTLMVSHDSEDALAAAGPILQLPADSSLT
jgi:putative thiamine transport system ATP-binding protein